MDNSTDGKTKVLVVEDTPMAAKIAQLVLQSKGCMVEWVDTGEKALGKIAADYSFILIDIGLPGIDGFETTRRLRNGNADISAVPIIALSAHEDNPEKINLAKTCGMNGFMSKPLTLEKCDQLLNKFVYSKATADYFMAP